jgi:hypothetical protein
MNIDSAFITTLYQHSLPQLMAHFETPNTYVVTIVNCKNSARSRNKSLLEEYCHLCCDVMPCGPLNVS